MPRPLLALALVAAAPLALTLLAAPAGADDAPRVPTRVLDVSDLPTGAPPAIAWSERTGGTVTIHAPSGDAPAPATLTALAPMGSGYVVQTIDQGRPNARPRVRWIAADGTPGRSSWRTGWGLAASAQGRAVAFTVRDGGVRVIDSEGDRVVRMPSAPTRATTAPAVVSGEDCVEDADSNGCAVLVNATGRRQLSWVVSSHGIVDRVPFLATSTGRGRWTGGITEVSDTGTCSAMTRNTRTQWTTCRNRFSDISPDTRHVLGIPAYGDGFGPTTLDVLDLRDGHRVRGWRASRTGDSATYFDEVWEDPEHLLVVTFQRREWAVVRLGLDGSMEYAVAPRRGSELRMPLRLQTR